ncbi:Glycosyl hydrolases family 18 [Musa troglodytarum]|uniref:Glycosyl hydrolases family 18 n=1 Tax=Musa troglodytarum TaxID=320322 RepID=A0A9E7I129_9LILI|nr:Glycosyl hydrolases family 18 [Musa troglodytarum]
MASFAAATLFFLLQALLLLPPSAASSSNLFREYIGVQFHFILAFAIDYTTLASPTPTNGNFNIFWDSQNLSPARAAAIKRSHPNVVGGRSANFTPTSVDSWVDNAVSSLTRIIKQYHLDGIDVDYEHFEADPDTFAECVGRLVTRLKRSGVISFASIAPFDDAEVQRHYLALWKKYGKVIDYVNFQFYAYDAGTTVSQFLSYFDRQKSNYRGGRILASISTETNPGGLSPQNGFFRACKTLKKQGKLGGIFIWAADSSKSDGFRYEKQAQSLLSVSS